MAYYNKQKLPVHKVSKFKNWLMENGWEIIPPKNTYELFQARITGRSVPLVVLQKKNDLKHYYVYDRDYHILMDFLSYTEKI